MKQSSTKVNYKLSLLAALLLATFLLEHFFNYQLLTTNSQLISHALAIIRHANVFHLAGNIFCLWILRRRLRIAEATAIAYLCSFIRTDGITIGFSGVVFALVGIIWGETVSTQKSPRRTLQRFATRCLPFALVGFLIPHIDGLLHTTSLITGLAYGYLSATRQGK